MDRVEWRDQVHDLFLLSAVFDGSQDRPDFRYHVHDGPPPVEEWMYLFLCKPHPERVNEKLVPFLDRVVDVIALFAVIVGPVVFSCFAFFVVLSLRLPTTRSGIHWKASRARIFTKGYCSVKENDAT
mmetsp:Transcript_53970/g.156790  ORF Transcript_53970/g.156790 Transcript_53970/m.156790 type:complete len:127 (+) Transcript_53970:307-687(+)